MAELSTDTNHTGKVNSSEIKGFVRQKLGCKCPDKVFSSIRVVHKPELFKGLPIDCLVEIGNRLLIAVSGKNTQKLHNKLAQVYQTGNNYRDQHGYSRFRLVIATHDQETRLSLQSAFSSLEVKDEYAYIHLIDPEVLPETLRT